MPWLSDVPAFRCNCGNAKFPGIASACGRISVTSYKVRRKNNMQRSWQLLHDGISCCTQDPGAKIQHKPLIHSHDTPSSALPFISVLLGLSKLFRSPRGISVIGKPIPKGTRCLTHYQHERVEWEGCVHSSQHLAAGRAGTGVCEQ